MLPACICAIAGRTFPAARQDRYFDEIALVAEALGAREVPRSQAAVDGYIEAMRHNCVCDDRTRKTLQLVLNAPAPNALAQPWTRLMMRAGVDLLPPWAQRCWGHAALAVAQRTAAPLGTGGGAAIALGGAQRLHPSGTAAHGLAAVGLKIIAARSAGLEVRR
jgi:uncharacterized protein (DUF2236 family)